MRGSNRSSSKVHYVGETPYINGVAGVHGIDIVNTATQRKNADACEGRGIGRLLNLTQRNCSSRRISICSDQVSVAVVVIVSGIDGIGKCKATYGWLRTRQRPDRQSHTCAVAEPWIEPGLG